MKKVCVCTAIALTGCSTVATDIAPARAAPIQYSSYDCERLTSELRRMYTRAAELVDLGDNAEPAEYARLITEHDALREAARMKKCAGRPTPALQQATPGSPEDESVAISLNLAETQEEMALVGKQGAAKPFLGIVTDDCLADYRRMKDVGVKFHGEPKVEPYGTGVTLEDLYGNRIYLNQEPA